MTLEIWARVRRTIYVHTVKKNKETDMNKNMTNKSNNTRTKVTESEKGNNKKSVAKAKKEKKCFGVLVFESTHRNAMYNDFDRELAEFLSQLFPPKGSPLRDKWPFSVENTAVLLLADHGMHFGSEYARGAGKIAIKQPLGYVYYQISISTHIQ